MADEVIDGLGNMKLTSEEEEIIPISDEGRVEAIGVFLGNSLHVNPSIKERLRSL